MSGNIEHNKALVLEAMTALFQRRDAAAVERLYAPGYIQHNPSIPQGREALAGLVAQLPSDLFYEPGLMVAEGAYVAIHGRIRGWAPTPQVVVDLFRIENGLLAEHWDVLQDEVTTDTTQSGLSMFSPDERTTQLQRQPTSIASPQAGIGSSAANANANAEAVDYDGLMQANLTQVFGERDAGRRLVAIRRIYAADALLNEPHATVQGHAAINDAVSALLVELPPDFAFRARGKAIGHHGIGVLQWASGPRDGAVAVTGMDVARFQDGRIQSLSVFLHPSPDA